jgi:hypothetical protein
MMAECPLIDWVENRIAEASAYHNCNYHQEEDFFACNRGRALSKMQGELKVKATETCGKVV